MSGAALGATTTFRHEAMLYADEGDYVAAALPFISAGLELGERILVAVSASKGDLLRGAVGADDGAVTYADMADLGHNPARIIPAWRDFLDQGVADGVGVRGIGEPIWAGRSPAEIVECQRHESLLNVAFDDGPGWRLMCPYDVSALDERVIHEAWNSHPVIVDDGNRVSGRRAENLMSEAHLHAGLPEPAEDHETLVFGYGSVAAVRDHVDHLAQRQGMPPDRAFDLRLAVSEVMANSLQHGGGGGVLRVWRELGRLVCEVRDKGRLDDPMAGRVAPELDVEGKRGLWLVNQLCDLVQIRVYPEGTVLRLHMAV